MQNGSLCLFTFLIVKKPFLMVLTVRALAQNVRGVRFESHPEHIFSVILDVLGENSFI